MNKLDIGAMAENIFSHVNLYINRYMADMKKYVDGQIGTAKEHTDQMEERLLKLRVDVIDQTKDYVLHAIEEAETRIQNKPADTGGLGELAGTVRNLERRAGRHAEHLLKLESRIHTLEGKKNET